MCGGTPQLPPDCPPDSGLSPRVRGNQRYVKTGGHKVWSIPACAGEPKSGTGTSAPSGVYPRVCGGTRRSLSSSSPSLGLSPRVRGNPLYAPERLNDLRSIPACAGEPRRLRPPGNYRRVYPRVCGGTSSRGKGRGCVCGLSPRVRGNQAYECDDRPPARSIPACAGEPSPRRRPRSAPVVYPRVCGGTHPGGGCRRAASGLSPRVRGNPPGSR